MEKPGSYSSSHDSTLLFKLLHIESNEESERSLESSGAIECEDWDHLATIVKASSENLFHL